MTYVLKLLISLSAVAAVATASAESSIDTTASWNGTNSVGRFGEPDTATYGQTITADSAGGVLKSFTFYLTGLDLNIRGYVFGWDGVKAVGPALADSGTFNIGDTFSGFKAVTVATGDVALAANQQYVLLLTSSGLQAGKFNSNTWGALTSNAYSGGELVFHNSGNDLSSLSADPGWDCADGCGFAANGGDLAFKAQIALAPALVPEPAGHALMLVGLGVALLTRLRQSAERKPTQSGQVLT